MKISLYTKEPFLSAESENDIDKSYLDGLPMTESPNVRGFYTPSVKLTEYELEELTLELFNHYFEEIEKGRNAMELAN